MFNFICKSFPHLRDSIRALPTQRLHFFQLNNLLSSQSTKTLKKLISDNAKDDSFTVNYLINKCGFAPEKAISASKYVNFNKPDKPDAVIAFLKNQGFSENQVLKIIKTCPPIICSDPKKTLLPKIELFRFKGFPKTCLASIFVNAPVLFRSSLERQIVPAFDFLKDMIGSVEPTIFAIKRQPTVLLCLRSYLVPNIEILREAGVPESNIAHLVKNSPRTFLRSRDRFKELVEEVKEMGLNPLRLMFIFGVQARSSLTRSNWKKKMDIYKRWGCTEEDVKEAFRKHPTCLTLSEDKIMRIIDVLVKEMSCDPSTVMKRPRLIASSLKKTIIPRCSVYQVLLSKGLIKKKFSLIVLLESPEKVFLKKFVECYEAEAPTLLKLCREKLENSPSDWPIWVRKSS